MNESAYLTLKKKLTKIEYSEDEKRILKFIFKDSLEDAIKYYMDYQIKHIPESIYIDGEENKSNELQNVLEIVKAYESMLEGFEDIYK